MVVDSAVEFIKKQAQEIGLETTHIEVRERRENILFGGAGLGAGHLVTCATESTGKGQFMLNCPNTPYCVATGLP